MTEEKYNTKDIRHIDEKNQKYIAEGNKMTEEIRPICLYVETCLDRKEGTRDCAKCEHHLNYWTEVMIRDMEKNINRLEQENKELKSDVLKWQKAFSRQYQINENKGYSKTEDKYRSALEKILESAKFAQCLPCGSGNLEDCLNCDDHITNNGQFCMEKRIHEIKTKCVEVLGE